MADSPMTQGGSRPVPDPTILTTQALEREVGNLKDALADFKDQLDREGDLSEVKKTLQNTAQELRNVAAVPRAISPMRITRCRSRH